MYQSSAKQPSGAGYGMTLDIPRRPSVLDDLAGQKDALEKQLADVNAAIEALNSNPEFSKCFELLSKVVRY